METDQIMSAIFLIASFTALILLVLSTNSKLKQFLNNLSIWTSSADVYCSHLFD